MGEGIGEATRHISQTGPTPEAGNISRDASLPGMVFIPGGVFHMGSTDHYPEERPVHRVWSSSPEPVRPPSERNEPTSTARCSC